MSPCHPSCKFVDIIHSKKCANIQKMWERPCSTCSQFRHLNLNDSIAHLICGIETRHIENRKENGESLNEKCIKFMIICNKNYDNKC